MHFEHIVEINTTQISVAPAFTRDELWRGLMVRVYEPEAFPEGPTSSEWREGDEPGVVHRVVHFGPLAIHDTVTLEPMQRIVFDAHPRPDMAPLRLTITLEEPAPGAMLLRFVYQSTAEVQPDEAVFEKYRHSAWLENDLDMVRTLRAWLEQGRLASV